MITSLSLNTYMVINYGARGAAIASVITYSLMALTCFLLVRRYFLVKNKKLFVE